MKASAKANRKRRSAQSASRQYWNIRLYRKSSPTTLYKVDFKLQDGELITENPNTNTFVVTSGWSDSSYCGGQMCQVSAIFLLPRSRRPGESCTGAVN